MHRTLDTTTDGRQPPPSLRLLAGLVWLCLPLLLVFTLVTSVFTIGKGLFGGDELFVDGWTNEVVVEHTPPSGTTQRHALSDGSISPDSPPAANDSPIFTSVSVRAAVSGAAPRLIVVLVALLKLGIGWLAWFNLHQIARSTLRGEIFTHANSSRLARIGAVAIMFPIATWFIGRALFDSVVTDAQVGVNDFWVDEGVDSWPLWIGAGLLLLTLSRSFRWGVELQELEAATI